MIKVLDKDHPMAKYATCWCRFDYPKGMSFVEFLEMLEHIGTIDGAEWQEVSIKKDYKLLPSKLYLVNPVTEGKDWYWCWSVADRIDRDQIDVFLTTEVQATYFAIARTKDFPEEITEDQLSREILNKIKSRAAAAATQVQSQTVLDQIRDRMMNSQPKKNRAS